MTLKSIRTLQVCLSKSCYYIIVWNDCNYVMMNGIVMMMTMRKMMIVSEWSSGVNDDDTNGRVMITMMIILMRVIDNDYNGDW